MISTTVRRPGGRGLFFALFDRPGRAGRAGRGRRPRRRCGGRFACLSVCVCVCARASYHTHEISHTLTITHTHARARATLAQSAECCQRALVCAGARRWGQLAWPADLTSAGQMVKWSNGQTVQRRCALAEGAECACRRSASVRACVAGCQMVKWSKGQMVKSCRSSRSARVRAWRCQLTSPQLVKWSNSQTVEFGRIRSNSVEFGRGIGREANCGSLRRGGKGGRAGGQGG